MSDTVGLLEAILAVQGEAPTLPKDAVNPHFKSKYTPLDTIVEKIGPILNKHGLVWTALPSYSDVGPTLRYKLAHAPSKDAIEGEMPLLLSKQDAQGQGSAITYARRYALCAVLNLVADDDDDGARAAQSQSQGGKRADYGPASDKQIALVRSLFTKNKVTKGMARSLLTEHGVTVEENEDPRDACARLRKPGVSDLIDRLNQGALPTGVSDVPPAEPGDFVREPIPGGDDLPFDPSVPA